MERGEENLIEREEKKPNGKRRRWKGGNIGRGGRWKDKMRVEEVEGRGGKRLGEGKGWRRERYWED